MKMFVTGATGNVGRSILSHAVHPPIEIVAGVRRIDDVKTNTLFSKTTPVYFDFDDIPNSNIPMDADVVFLMRPPRITDPRLFSHILEKLQASKPHIIFLSIQGADKKEYTPHRKIEHQIIQSGLNYTFIRPSYFMENLVTTLYGEIKENKRIYLPSGRMKLNWLSVDDLGELICHIAQKPEMFINQAIEITGTENEDFNAVVSIINKTCGTQLKYENPNVFAYVISMLFHTHEKVGYVAIMLLLHWLPKFGNDPERTNRFQEIVGRNPMTLEAFARKNAVKFL